MIWHRCGLDHLQDIRATYLQVMQPVVTFDLHALVVFLPWLFDMSRWREEPV